MLHGDPDHRRNGDARAEPRFDGARDALTRDLALVAQGDRAALQRVYVATSAKLFGVCLRILPERAEAEEVLQDVYLTVWTKAAEFDSGRASPITWLATIARNRALDRWRSRARRATRPLEEAAEIHDGRPNAAEIAEFSDEARRLGVALATLEPRTAAAIRSAFFEGCTYETLAIREGVPLGTMKSWIRRGLMAMRDQLESRS